MQQDKILIRGLNIHCIVGILEHERKTPQDLAIDIDMHTDFSLAAETEDVEHTVDYAAVSNSITDLVKSKQFWLLETMSRQIIDHIFSNHQQVSKVRVSIQKPQAVSSANWVGVESTQTR